MGDKMGVGADFDSPSSVDEKLLARPRQAGFRSPSTGGRNPRRHLKRRCLAKFYGAMAPDCVDSAE